MVPASCPGRRLVILELPRSASRHGSVKENVAGRQVAVNDNRIPSVQKNQPLRHVVENRQLHVKRDVGILLQHVVKARVESLHHQNG